MTILNTSIYLLILHISEWQTISETTGAIQLPPLPFTLQVETEWSDDVYNDDLVIVLVPKVNPVNNSVNIEFQLTKTDQEFFSTHCDQRERAKIPNNGTGIWTFEMSDQNMKVSLGGENFFFSDNKCLMDYITSATKIEFSDKDDISQSFRFPGKN